MELLRNRKIAILITVVAAILATLLGISGTANRDSRDVEAMFYNGVYLKDEGYTQPGIDSHLNNAANAALGLATILEKYPELESQAGELIRARWDLIASAGIGEKSAANLEMCDRFYNLLDATVNTWLSVPITDRDSDALAHYSETFRSASNTISSSRYNDEVAAYLGSRSFIVRVIGIIVPIKEPDYFTAPPIVR